MPPHKCGGEQNRSKIQTKRRTEETDVNETTYLNIRAKVAVGALIPIGTNQQKYTDASRFATTTGMRGDGLGGEG